MGMQFGVRALVAVGVLLALIVIGLAAKIGRDTSQYLQTVSTQRNWGSPGQDSGKDATAVQSGLSEGGSLNDSIPAAAASEAMAEPGSVNL